MNLESLLKEEPPKLKMLGKDYHAMMVYGAEYIVDDSSIAFLVSDSEKNLHMMAYAPDCKFYFFV